MTTTSSHSLFMRSKLSGAHGISRIDRASLHRFHPLTSSGVVLFSALVCWLGVGCAPTPESIPCVIEYDAEGQARALCDRQEPIPLSQPPSVDARCTLDLTRNVLMCTDTRYDPVTGEPLPDDEEGGVGGEGDSPVNSQDGEMTPGSGEGGSVGGRDAVIGVGAVSPTRLYAKTPCTRILEQVVCSSGALGVLDDGAGEDLVCYERVLPGVGRRIVCVEPGEAPTVLVPEGLDLAREQSCDVLGSLIVCEEGTTYMLEEGEECENPRLDPLLIDLDVLFACMDRVDNKAEGEPVAVALGEMCQSALEAPIVCDEGGLTSSSSPSACIAPTGQVRVSSQEDAEALASLGCVEIWGDVVIAPLERDPELEEVPWAEDERVPVSWVLALEGVRGVHGSVRVEHTELLPDTERTRREFQIGLDQLDIGFVTGDYQFIAHRGLQTWRWPEALGHVGGTLELTRLTEMEKLEIEGSSRFGFQVGADLMLQDLSELDRTELSDVHVEGQLVMIETPKLEGCELSELLDWAFDSAGGLIWVQAFYASPKPPSACPF